MCPQSLRAVGASSNGEPEASTKLDDKVSGKKMKGKKKTTLTTVLLGNYALMLSKGQKFGHGEIVLLQSAKINKFVCHHREG